MNRMLAATAAVALSLSAAASAATVDRIRGTVTAVTADSVTVKTADKEVTIALTGDTKYVKVVKSSLDNVDKDAFIGTATKEVGGKLIALEVVVFPAAMRGTGEGHYGWDRIHDTTTAGGGSTGSMMTNGTVASVQAQGATANSTMTNGTVSSADSKGGAKQITVTYKGGEQTILVPPTAPIVGFQPDDKSDLTTGKVVFVPSKNEDGKLTANVVAIGTPGAPPPM